MHDTFNNRDETPNALSQVFDPNSDSITLNNIIQASSMTPTTTTAITAIASSTTETQQQDSLSNSENGSRKTSTASDYTPDSTIVIQSSPENKIKRSETIENSGGDIITVVADEEIVSECDNRNESLDNKTDEKDGDGITSSETTQKDTNLKIPQRKISRFLVSPVLDKLEIPESMQQSVTESLTPVITDNLQPDLTPQQPICGPETINTLEQLQIGLENITHVGVKKLKDDNKESAAATPTDDEKTIDTLQPPTSQSFTASPTPFASIQPNLPLIPEGVLVESSTATQKLVDNVIDIQQTHEDVDESISSEQFSSTGTSSIPPLRVDASRRASCELVLDSTALSTWNSSLSNTPDSTILPNSSDQAALLNKKVTSQISESTKMETLQTLHRRLSQLTAHSDVITSAQTPPTSMTPNLSTDDQLSSSNLQAISDINEQEILPSEIEKSDNSDLISAPKLDVDESVNIKSTNVVPIVPQLSDLELQLARISSTSAYKPKIELLPQPQTTTSGSGGNLLEVDQTSVSSNETSDAKVLERKISRFKVSVVAEPDVSQLNVDFSKYPDSTATAVDQTISTTTVMCDPSPPKLVNQSSKLLDGGNDIKIQHASSENNISHIKADSSISSTSNTLEIRKGRFSIITHSNPSQELRGVTNTMQFTNLPPVHDTTVPKDLSSTIASTEPSTASSTTINLMPPPSTTDVLSQIPSISDATPAELLLQRLKENPTQIENIVHHPLPLNTFQQKTNNIHATTLPHLSSAVIPNLPSTAISLHDTIAPPIVVPTPHQSVAVTPISSIITSTPQQPIINALPDNTDINTINTATLDDGDIATALKELLQRQRAELEALHLKHQMEIDMLTKKMRKVSPQPLSSATITTDVHQTFSEGITDAVSQVPVPAVKEQPPQ